MEKEVFHRKPRMRLFHKSHYRKSHGLTSQPDNAWAEFSTIIIGVRPHNWVHALSFNSPTYNRKLRSVL